MQAVVPDVAYRRASAQQGPSTNAATQAPLNVLIVTASFLPTLGGVQTHVALLASGLAKMGHLTTVVTTAEAHNFDDIKLPFQVIRRPGLVRLWSMIGKADVLQLAGPTFIPLLLGLIRRKPIVVEHHGYQAICPNGMLLEQPDQVVCPGHFMEGHYEKCLRCVAVNDGYLSSLWRLLCAFPRHWMCRHAAINAPVTKHVLTRLGLDRSRVIYLGIPEVERNDLNWNTVSSRPLVFAYVGRLVTEKGLPLLVQAAAELDEQNYKFSLKFVGDGPERSRLEDLVAANNLANKVTFTGFLRGEELNKALEDVAAVVMPSICEETAGLAAMEQMMRGRLVIVSDIGGLGEVVSGSGLKFKPGSVSELTSCMRRVLDHPGLVNTVGSDARNRCLSMFHEDQMIDNHISAYFEVLQSRSKRFFGWGA